MITCLRGGLLYDPVQALDGVPTDVFFEDGIICTRPDNGAADHEIDVSGCLIMAGAIDMHTHIGGGKVNIARTMMLEDHRAHRHSADSELDLGAGSGLVSPSTLSAGYRYAEMGYTTCFEPAILPSNARQAHMEMADTPIVDTGGYVLLGNDDFLLQILAKQGPNAQSMINDYVAWMLNATQTIGIKVVNPGGINAFKFNARRLDVDEPAPHYGVSARQIVAALAQALETLQVPHPLHVHCSNLGVPGNYRSTLDTIAASGGLPIHLTHVQFHSYGNEGPRQFSSAAAQIAEAINANPNISVDVGQIMFGQTVTCSADSMSQYANHHHAHPKRWTCMDIECEAGCGVVPFRYRDKAFVNALQWAIGLELFLLVDDPWRLGLTTDHPNGGPFTSYPHLIKLLMDRNFRNDKLAQLNKAAAAATHLASIQREYTLYEIATLTRAAPARLLGLKDLGHLSPGARADVVVYRPQADIEAQFQSPEWVFKSGQAIVRDGRIVAQPKGRTHTVKPSFDAAIEKPLKSYFESTQTMRLGNFKISTAEMAEDIGTEVLIHPCNRHH